MIGKKSVAGIHHRAFLVQHATPTECGTGFMKRIVLPSRNCLRGVNFSLGTGHPICLIENGGIGGSLWGITPNSPLTASTPAPRPPAGGEEEEGRIFLAAPFTMGILSLRRRRELREKNIFRSPSPFRTAVRERERERERKYGFSIHFQFLGPAPWEREAANHPRGLFLRRDPLSSLYLLLSELLLPSSSRIMRELVFPPVSLISKDNNVLIRL